MWDETNCDGEGCRVYLGGTIYLPVLEFPPNSVFVSSNSKLGDQIKVVSGVAAAAVSEICPPNGVWTFVRGRVSFCIDRLYNRCIEALCILAID